MPDIAHVMGGDLTVSATGDLLTASGSAETTQRLLRRFMTARRAYLWNLPYGAGAPLMVGQPTYTGAIQADFQAQMLQESGVSQSPPPIVNVTKDAFGTAAAGVVYTDAATQQPIPLTVPLG